VGTQLAIGSAAAVRTVVDAVVAGFVVGLLNDGVAADGAEQAARGALFVAAVVHAVVALFAGADFSVAAVALAITRGQVEAAQREPVRRA
jgi:hypothetical protein